jgi:hypothetical protein
LWAQKDRKVRVLPGDKLGYLIGETDAESRVRYCCAVLERLRDSHGSNDAFSGSADATASKGRGASIALKKARF